MQYLSHSKKYDFSESGSAVAGFAVDASVEARWWQP